MSKLRITLGLVGMVCAFGVVVAPAMAWFQGATAQRGNGTAGVSTLTGGNAAAVCEKAEGGWEVWSKGEAKAATKIAQAEVTVGPHELIAVSKWNNCTVEIQAKKIASTVTPCNFQLKQPEKGQTTGVTADVASECIITAGTCIIKVAQANGGVNETLGSITLANSGSNLIQNAENVTGVTGNVNAACKALGAESFSGTGTFKSVITDVGQKEV